MHTVLGIHHITAISSDPQRTLDFYTGLLGLRFVKRTVNFDDPRTYHFYFGDGVGTPGSILTFFPWPGARRGRVGSGQTAVTSFAAAPGALAFWVERLRSRGVAVEDAPRSGPGQAPDDRRLVDPARIAFRDFDGLALEIVESDAAAARAGWDGHPEVPAHASLRGFHDATLWVAAGEPTGRVLTDVLGFRPLGGEAGERRFASGDQGPGTLVSVDEPSAAGRGTSGAGTVHHIAFRVADEAAQLELRSRVAAAGLAPTPVIDRTYFRSVYFREPGGVLFELATDGPGFAVDEPVEALGEALQLPPQYAPHRDAIAAVLPPVRLPGAEPSASGDAAAASPAGEARGDADPPPRPSWPHVFEPGAAGAGDRVDGAGDASGATLLLLHGTGGDERDLLPLGRLLAPGAALLSPRGPVNENGMPRFFRRVAEGVFDVDDLFARAGDLAAFLDEAAAHYGLDRGRIFAAGFSNGANAAVGVLLRHPGALSGAVLLSPMLPYDPGEPPSLEGVPVFIGAGRRDPIAPAAQVERLEATLRAAGADVRVDWEDGGHAISRAEVDAAATWLRPYIQGSSAVGP
jgi:predicted esterase/catechol 2,3-dioxygenase-like lactoylglutathione lyase family enzyme